MKKYMKRPSLVNLILLAVIIGIIFGIILPDLSIKISVVGEIFLRLMQMSIPLLVLGQIIQAISSITKDELSTIGYKTILIFSISSILAAYWGIIFGIVFKPGEGVNISSDINYNINNQDLSIKDTILNFFPENIMNSLSNGVIVQIIIFAIFFGIAMSIYLQENPASQFLDLIKEFNEIIMNVVKTIMKFAPIGIFSLISTTIANTGLSVIVPLLKYLIIYAIATIIFMVLWISIVSLYCRISPFFILKGIKDMSIMAISTVSSAVTLPVAMSDSKEKLKISHNIVDLVLPLGVSLNSNGAAMHMAITVITVSQLYNINFTFNQYIYLGILATFVSLANAVVPGASLVSLAIIFPQMGLPIESIALFAGLDYFVGMIRTILNVDSDVFSAMLVEKSVERRRLKKGNISTT